MVLSLKEQFQTIKPTKRVEPFKSSDKDTNAQILKELGKEGFGKSKVGTTVSKQRYIQQQIENEIQNKKIEGMENYIENNPEEPEFFDIQKEIEQYEDVAPSIKEMEKEAFEGEEDFRRRCRRRRRRRRRGRRSRSRSRSRNSSRSSRRRRSNSRKRKKWRSNKRKHLARRRSRRSKRPRKRPTKRRRTKKKKGGSSIMKTISIAIGSILAILGAVAAFFKISKKPLPGFIASKLAGSKFGITVLTFFNTPVPAQPVVPIAMTSEMAAAVAAAAAAVPAIPAIPAISSIGGKRRKRKTRKKKN
jgi:hypothetical protein